MSEPPSQIPSPDELRQIDLLCDQWERLLQLDQRPDVQSLLDQLPAGRLQAVLLGELLATQLDRLAADSTQPTTPTPVADPLLAFVQQAEREFPMLRSFPHDLAKLVGRAFSWSQRQKECPTVDQYVGPFAAFPGVELAVRKMLAETWPAELLVLAPWGRSCVSLAEPLVLGRQLRDDPPPIAMAASDATGASPDRRLVIAPMQERRVSRRHLRLELVARHRVQLTNVSQRSEVLLADADVVPPGQSIIQSWPVRMRIVDIEFSLQAAGP